MAKAKSGEKGHAAHTKASEKQKGLPGVVRRDIKVNRQSAEGLFDRSFPPTPITREKVARLVHKPIPIYCVPDPSEEVVFVCRLMALRKDGPGRMKCVAMMRGARGLEGRMLEA